MEVFPSSLQRELKTYPVAVFSTEVGRAGIRTRMFRTREAREARYHRAVTLRTSGYPKAIDLCVYLSGDEQA